MSSGIESAVMKFGQIMRDEQKLCLVGAQIEMFDFFVGTPCPMSLCCLQHDHLPTADRGLRRGSRRGGATRCPVMTSSCLPRARKQITSV